MANFSVKVYISYRKGILDPQGVAVEKAAHSLGFNKVKDVRVGKQIILALDESDETKAKKDVEAMCEDLLANTVIENYEIEIVK